MNKNLKTVTVIFVDSLSCFSRDFVQRELFYFIFLFIFIFLIILFILLL